MVAQVLENSWRPSGRLRQRDDRHPYLGRRLKILVSQAERDRVFATNGILHVETRFPEAHDRQHPLVRRWMRGRALRFLQRRFNAAIPLVAQLNIEVPRLSLRGMKRQWATRSRCGTRMCLSVKLIELPPACIDYVIVSELCRISAQRNAANYLSLISGLMPTWQRRHDTLVRFAQTSKPRNYSRRVSHAFGEV